MSIEVGTVVRTKLGEVGRVEAVSRVNGIPHYRLRILTATAWGAVATLTTALVNDGDLVAVKRTTPGAKAASVA